MRTLVFVIILQGVREQLALIPLVVLQMIVVKQVFVRVTLLHVLLPLNVRKGLEFVMLLLVYVRIRTMLMEVVVMMEIFVRQRILVKVVFVFLVLTSVVETRIHQKVNVEFA